MKRADNAEDTDEPAVSPKRVRAEPSASKVAGTPTERYGASANSDTPLRHDPSSVSPLSGRHTNDIPTARNAFAVLMQNPQARLNELAASSPPLVPATHPPEVVDRQSRFTSHSARITSLGELDRVTALLHATPQFKGATHNIRAWRFLKKLKSGSANTGLAVIEAGGDRYAVVEGSDDDGEQWAGGKVLRLMQETGACDCVVVVSRWYGGVLLGPIRFHHIETMALSALRAGGFVSGGPAITSRFFGQRPPIEQDKPLSSLPPADAAPSRDFATTAPPSENPEMLRLRRILRARDATLSALREKLRARWSEEDQQLRAIEEMKGGAARRKPGVKREESLVNGSRADDGGGQVAVRDYTDVRDVGEAERMVRERDEAVEAVKREIFAVRERIEERKGELEDASFEIARMGSGGT
ncbi:ribosomal protein S5 domain 2-type protein [Zopfochytrium polystomum]|nr:ribosomal protein S5 domain 2-type protein [Zopfochytrium polystomum]